MRALPILAVSSALVLGAVFGGCGGSSSSSEPTASATSPAAKSGQFAELPTKRCETKQGITTPSVPLDKTTVVPASESELEGFAAYRDSSGSTVVAPRGWQCEAVVAADGGESIKVTPDGQDPFEDNTTQAVTYLDGGACQGCMAEELCALFPTAAPVQAYAPGFKCDKPKPLRETVSKTDKFTAYFEDPPEVTGQGTPSGGSYRAIGILTYSDAIGARKVTCTLDESLEHACPAVASASMLSSFMNLPG